MNLQEIYDKANQVKLENNALTVNERLYQSGLTEPFDNALINNKTLAVEILKALKVGSKSIEQIVYTK
ncbi:MAG: hypothetical protein ABF274_04960 [Nonlabens sp.]|uniref:hypothetical protein n=1 Tax=Nonlabens sp. TaxID=1888209 RepID=UPI00321A710E